MPPPTSPLTLFFSFSSSDVYRLTRTPDLRQAVITHGTNELDLLEHYRTELVVRTHLCNPAQPHPRFVHN